MYHLAPNILYVHLYYFGLWFPAAGDISGAVQTLRTLLLFYPSDKDSLDNLQLYSETLGGATETQGTQPHQVALNGHEIKSSTTAVLCPIMKHACRICSVYLP